MLFMMSTTLKKLGFIEKDHKPQTCRLTDPQTADRRPRIAFPNSKLKDPFKKTPIYANVNVSWEFDLTGFDTVEVGFG